MDKNIEKIVETSRDVVIIWVDDKNNIKVIWFQNEKSFKMILEIYRFETFYIERYLIKELLYQ
ncbi:hypothetical protein [Clostridium thailandense]|uniref:hypothetical protein n=1 Tax=Clostridium thailandense TaxID=2794346 RepID=UPI0039896D45